MDDVPVISIIDDDASVRVATNRLVRSLGYIAHTFASGDEFLRSPQLTITSCVIADIHMPGMSGIELQSRLRAQGHRLPIIFITAFPDEGIRARAMDAGAMVMYRGGAQVAFERNASRAYVIPYFAADIGGLWSDATGRRWYVDGGVGLYVVHRRNVIVDVELTGLLPFSDPSRLGGFTSRLGLSFALW